MPAVTLEARAVPALTHLLFLQQLGLGVQLNLLFSLYYLYHGQLVLKNTFDTIINCFRGPQNVTDNL